ncbi:hypothetical protein Pyn_24102 [Prunus yedoensis var. nudiflora]|uniref:S1 motif domain-containing protein n=1 Tax=Prunus yedoensis var. nudiflora TaxID=2094558 RepID=A0A314Y6V7_PRUYE|nr:hypothetical protein Pyn_24102 [Prunus yedoensis var. nudiflora]
MMMVMIGEGIQIDTISIREMGMKTMEMLRKMVMIGEVIGIGGMARTIWMSPNCIREGGLVHVSHVETRRISNAKDVVKRDQEVYVKVISISGPKLSLSMRDVDQHTGKDLLPLKKSSEDDALRTNPSFSKDGPVTRTGLSGIRIVREDDVGPSRRPLKE